MSNYMEEVFAPADAVYREAVMRDAWGHLAPKVGVKYTGYIIVAQSWDTTSILDYEFEGCDGGPWLLEDVSDFVCHQEFTEYPVMYQFQGWYKLFKNGNYRFGGGRFMKIFGINEKRFA